MRSSRYMNARRRRGGAAADPRRPAGPRARSRACCAAPRAAAGRRPDAADGLTRFRANTHMPFQDVGPTDAARLLHALQARANPQHRAVAQRLHRLGARDGDARRAPGRAAAATSGPRSKLAGFDFAQCSGRLHPDASADGAQHLDALAGVGHLRRRPLPARLRHDQATSWAPSSRTRGSRSSCRWTAWRPPPPANPLERSLGELWLLTAHADGARATATSFKRRGQTMTAWWIWELAEPRSSTASPTRSTTSRCAAIRSART